MESALDRAYGLLPTLNKEELRQLQRRISDLLGENTPDFLVPLSEATLEVELDAAIAEFDSGAGYDADEMLSRVRRRFGWERT